MSTINKQKEVNIHGENFVIKPFVLRNRDKVLKTVAQVFSELSKKYPDMKTAPQGELIVDFINIAGDKLIELYEMILVKDKEWLMDNLTLEDEVNVIYAVMEVNNFPLLVSQIKKLRGKD